jgi:CheY-like chemotaxis protein
MTTSQLGILLIDDDPIFRLTTTKILKTAFPELPHVTTFQNGLEALEFFNKPAFEFHIVFLDLNMPFLDGWELLREMQHLPLFQGPEVPHVYILSSSTSLADLEQAKQFPLLKGYLVKPVTKEQLTETMNAYLEA